jgi:threonine dehydrogenase-like Zn-dependent dehydrogenase
MDNRSQALPASQFAVQLIGPSKLTLNRAKAVHKPGPRQIVAKVEAVGLCFSDLKLLKQFTDHPRKGPVVSGLAPEVLAQIPSYVPNEAPTVPGHETVCRIVAAGAEVKHHKVGERVLVQTDYRDIRTAGSNAAFGYNFEGALQEYVLMDERVIMEPATGQRFLIPVGEELSASAVCLVEPWACVEDSYVTVERQTIKAGGKLLVVADAGRQVTGLAAACSAGKPAQVTTLCADDSQLQAVKALGAPVTKAEGAAALGNAAFDDIVYFGADATTIEALNDRLGGRGIINIVTGGKKIGRPVSVGVGRVHYGMTRWIGTTGADASASYRNIPATGEVREGDRVVVVGAGGPMGQMHVIRDVCSGVKGVSVVASDVDDARLESLLHKAGPMAASRGVELTSANPKRGGGQGTFSYFALMAPVPVLVAGAIAQAEGGALINIFAGIPAPTRHELDLDTYIERRCFMFGTSGSVIRDMEIVLEKLRAGALDTDCSVDAVSGMAGAIDGLAAVENRTLAGKIIVYPCLHELGLVPLNQLAAKFPTVAKKLRDGFWCKAAEEELLRVAAR